MNDRMSDKELDAYCEEWVWWCYTRRFYLQPGAQNILARMQPAKVKEPPNARNSAEMQYFNMAIHAMFEMDEHKELAECFALLYFKKDDRVKVLLKEQEISRKTYYNRARSFVRKAMSLGRSFQVASEKMRVSCQESAHETM